MAAPESYDFNSYAAGNKVYGAGSPQPNLGPVSAEGLMGYRERDLQAQARKNAALRKLQAMNTQNYMSPDWLRGQNGVSS